MLRAMLACAFTIGASPAVAQLRVVPTQPASAEAAKGGVEVFFINDSAAPADLDTPNDVEVTASDGSRLVLMPDEAAPKSVAAHGFARLRYRPAPAPGTAGAASLLSPRPEERSIASSAGTASGFFDRFAPYEPTYGAAGLADSGMKLQFSVALQPIGGAGLLSHLRVAYTQTMFWALDRPSGPVRTTTYSPEVFFEQAVAPDLKLALGYRHDSNGEGDPGSIDVNRIYIRAAKSFDLGGRWHAELVPQAWIYIGRRGLTRDLDDYYGYTALKASILEDDGLKLSLTGRGNFATGKGAAELFASYPLARVGGIGLYLFGQAFTGYGEALDDYRVSNSHARLGLALTR